MRICGYQLMGITRQEGLQLMGNPYPGNFGKT